MERDRNHEGDAVVSAKRQELLGLKLRRGISLGSKGGSCTPAPAWKLEDTAAEEEEEEEEGEGPSESEHSAASDGRDRWRRRTAIAPARSSVSARKLGANLWEIQDLGMAHRRGAPKIHNLHPDDASDLSTSSQQDALRIAGSLRRHVSAPFARQQRPNGKINRDLQTVSPATYSSSKEIAAVNHVASPGSSLDFRGMTGEGGYNLKTSTELLKVLNRIWSLEEQQATHVTIVKALKGELKHARAHIQELMHERKAYRLEMDDLMKQVEEDKLTRKKREQERIKTAVQSIRDEVEDERRLRKRSENLHRKVGKELSEVKTALSKALKDLDREKEANGLLEELCDQFAKGVGDYELEARELKQKAKVDCDHKADRMVLHISEAWLDGRLQMKAAEDRGDVDEKNEILDRLSAEIIKFLQAKQSISPRNNTTLHKNGSLRRQSLESLHLNGATGAPQDADDDSLAGDLHCFELNLGVNSNDNEVHMLTPFCDNGIKKTNKRLSNARKHKMAYCGRRNGHNLSISQAAVEQMDDTKVCSGKKMQLADKLHGIHKHKDADVKSKEGQHTDSCAATTSNRCSTHEGGLNDQFSWGGQTVPNGEDSASAHFYTIHSPAQPGRDCSASPNAAISECSSKLPQWLKESTLKAKLLEARLEGQYARLKASKGSSMVGG